MSRPPIFRKIEIAMEEETGKLETKPRRRRALPKAGAVLAAALVLAAFALAGYFVWSARQADRARQAAEARRTEALVKTLAAIESRLAESQPPAPSPPDAATEELVKTLRALREGLDRTPPPAPPAQEPERPADTRPPAEPAGRLLVLGAVNRPGVVAASEGTTLLEAIALAGGPSTEASDTVEVRHVPAEDQSNPEKARYSLEKVMERGEPSKVVLSNGDMVFVQEQRKGKVFVVGEVQNPGAYPWAPNTTVFQTVVMAGGFTRYANRNAINIARTRNGQTSQIRASGNTPVQPGDIVFVTESWF